MNFGTILGALIVATWLYGTIWFTQVVFVVRDFDKRLRSAMLQDGRKYDKGDFWGELVGFAMTYTVVAFMCGLFAWHSDEFRMVIYKSAINGIKKSQPGALDEEIDALKDALVKFETS